MQNFNWIRAKSWKIPLDRIFLFRATSLEKCFTNLTLSGAEENILLYPFTMSICVEKERKEFSPPPPPGMLSVCTEKRKSTRSNRKFISISVVQNDFRKQIAKVPFQRRCWDFRCIELASAGMGDTRDHCNLQTLKISMEQLDGDGSSINQSIETGGVCVQLNFLIYSALREQRRTVCNFVLRFQYPGCPVLDFAMN